MEIVKRRVDELSNDPANARKHNSRNIETIVASLRRFGQQKPIVIDSTGVVRAGNGTLEAARQLDWEYIECVVTELKGSDAISYAIADNRSAELAEWDDATLGAQLNGLLADDSELIEAAGFTEAELDELLSQFNVDEVEPPALGEGDRDPFRQMTFTLHDSQYAIVMEAINLCKLAGDDVSDENENTNGNAIASICDHYRSNGSKS